VAAVRHAIEEGGRDDWAAVLEAVVASGAIDAARSHARAEAELASAALQGLPSNEGTLTAGAVSLPAFGMVLDTNEPPPTPPKHEGAPRLVVSRNRATDAAIVVAQALNCEVARLGSAGAKAMSVVLGETDIYVHAGGMHQWDSAAPVAVAQAAGLFTSRIDGSPLVYNMRDTWLPDLIVCQQHLAQQVIAALRAGRISR
jgi:3'(2'), 5'-bisphosphate nucleotidase